MLTRSEIDPPFLLIGLPGQQVLDSHPLIWPGIVIERALVLILPEAQSRIVGRRDSHRTDNGHVYSLNLVFAGGDIETITVGNVVMLSGPVQPKRLHEKIPEIKLP